MSIPPWLVTLSTFVVVEVQMCAGAWLWFRHVYMDDRLVRFGVRMVHFVMCELRPIYLPCAFVLLADDGLRHKGFWSLLWDAVSIVNYVWMKDEDDDRWKRRRAKVASKVQQAGSRLIVVPTST